MYDKSVSDAESAVQRAVWKLKALADIFSVLSSADGDELRMESFYGVSQIMQDELDCVERQSDLIAAHFQSIQD
jgi:hypothetical protein